MKYANLHLHSDYSDGILTPRELCETAKKMGYGAIAVSDHETCSGYAALAKAADELGLEHILGIELYAKVENLRSFHITGYDFDPTEHDMAEYLHAMWEGAILTTRARFEAMLAAGEIKGLTWQNVVDDAPESCWFCNEQIFASLIKRQGYRQEDYWDFIAKFRAHKPDVKVPSVTRDPKEVIWLIRNAGGVPILAHPHGQTQYLPFLCELGLMGVECDHPDIDPFDKEAARTYAMKHNLYISGGTDHTGQLANAPWQRGDTPLPAGMTAWEGYHCPLDTDVYSGVTKEEFDALKNRIYG